MIFYDPRVFYRFIGQTIVDTGSIPVIITSDSVPRKILQVEFAIANELN